MNIIIKKDEVVEGLPSVQQGGNPADREMCVTSRMLNTCKSNGAEGKNKKNRCRGGATRWRFIV